MHLRVHVPQDVGNVSHIPITNLNQYTTHEMNVLVSMHAQWLKDHCYQFVSMEPIRMLITQINQFVQHLPHIMSFLCVKMSKLLLMFDVDYLYDRLLFQELQEYLKDLEVWEHKLKDKQNNIASTPTIT